jgi:hypothetical protein
MVRFVSVTFSSERSYISGVSIMLSFARFLLSAIHIYIKLCALSIQEYDVEINKDKNTINPSHNNSDIESADITIISNHESNVVEVPMNEVIVDIERYVEEVNTYRTSVENMRLSNRESMTKLGEDSIISIAPKIHTASI